MERLSSTSMVVKACGVSTRQLYYWEMLGMIQPRYENFGLRRFRRYTEEDLERIRTIKHLLDQGLTLQAVRERMTHFDETAKEMELDIL